MTVHLVGAGPGDPDLLTVRAARLLGAADVVVHDRLVGVGVLDLAPGAEKVDVGKCPGGARWAQADINAELIDRGRRHDTVVRLKGGDPYVFGRGAEEALALRAAGVDVEVVPGVSSALAAPTAAGITVTHRAVSTGVTIVTASTAADTTGVDWAALAALDHTLVVLMGVRLAPLIATELLANGRPSDQPVAVVGSATTARQRSVVTTLGGLGSVDVAAPATIVIGDVAALGDLPAWRPTRPTRLHAHAAPARSVVAPAAEPAAASLPNTSEVRT